MAALNVGFVGLGDIGGPMAQQIINAGFPTTLWARSEATFAQFDPGSYTRAASLAQLGAACDIVGVCVFADDDVRQVLSGEGGIIAAMRPGGVVMIHATVSTAVCVEMGAFAKPYGVSVLDVPITGARVGALAGTLASMVGGDSAAFEKVRPVLESFSRQVEHVGPLGCGQKMKALNSVMSLCNGRVAAVAIETAVALGLAPEAAMTILRTGVARSFMLDNIIDNFLPDPVYRAHASRMVEKDGNLFRTMRKSEGLPVSLLDELSEQFAGNVIPRLPGE